jgi:hypothetical protein
VKEEQRSNKHSIAIGVRLCVRARLYACRSR